MTFRGRCSTPRTNLTSSAGAGVPSDGGQEVLRASPGAGRPDDPQEHEGALGDARAAGVHGQTGDVLVVKLLG